MPAVGYSARMQDTDTNAADAADAADASNASNARNANGVNDSADAIAELAAMALDGDPMAPDGDAREPDSDAKADAEAEPGDAAEIDINLGVPMSAAQAQDMDTAVRATINSMVADGGTAPNADEIASARAKAAALVAECGAGLTDLQNLCKAVALPGVRSIFTDMVRACGIRGALKHEARAAIRDFSTITEEGCYRVDFRSRLTSQPDVAYLTIGRCVQNHNLDAQMGKLQPHISDAEWPGFLKHCSALIGYTRTLYAETAKKHIALVRRINTLQPDEPCTDLLTLQVDSGNTTLYVKKEWKYRLGLFIQLGSELDAGSDQAQ